MLQNISWQRSITIEARVRLDELPIGPPAPIFSAEIGSTSISLEVDDSGKVHFYAPNNPGCTTSLDVPSLSILNVGQTYHVAGTVTGSGSMDIFIDGAQVNSVVWAVTAFNCSSAGYVAGNRTLGGAGFIGVIDDLRISTSAIPRYPTHGFTPPSGPLPRDSTTVSLLNFDYLEVLGNPIFTSPTANISSFAGRYIISPF